jgi:hypothetical protein
MKTTIEIGDELFRTARQRAAESGITFRALVEAGLRTVLARPRDEVPAPAFRVRVFAGPEPDAGLVAPYDRLGLHQAILDSYREAEADGRVPTAVHDRD